MNKKVTIVFTIILLTIAFLLFKNMFHTIWKLEIK